MGNGKEKENMKKYIIKDTLTDIETGVELIYFLGKDGYVHDESSFYWCDGYKRKGFALKKIESDILFYIRFCKGKLIKNMVCEESGRWVHHYEILTISGNAD